MARWRQGWPFSPRRRRGTKRWKTWPGCASTRSSSCSATEAGGQYERPFRIRFEPGGALLEQAPNGTAAVLPAHRIGGGRLYAAAGKAARDGGQGRREHEEHG